MAQPQAYYPDGTPIPAEEWQAAVQSGQARWEGGAEIKAVRPDGTRVSLPAEQYQDAIASGYRIAAPEEVAQHEREREFGTLGQTIATGAEGVARGLTLGLSDQFAREALGREHAERMAARQEVNPGAAAAGEIVGAVAPVLASGGTGALARGIAGVGALPRGAASLGSRAGALAERLAARQGTLGRITTRAITGGTEAAVEGALYGVGQAISDNALRDTELSADKILAAASDGALFAGLLGAGAGGLSGAASRGFDRLRDATLRRLGEDSTQEALQKFAERRAFKQVVGNYKRPFAEASAKGEGVLERAGRKMLNEAAPMRKLDEFIPWVEARTRRAADELKSVAKQLDDAGVRLKGESLLRRADEVIASYRGRGLDDFDKVAKRLEKKIAPLRKQLTPDDPSIAPRELTFSEFWKVRQDLDKTIFSRTSQGKGKTIQTDAMRELRDAFRAELDDMIERGQGPVDLKGAWKRASEDYGDFALLQKHSKEYAENRQKNRSISLTDYLAGIGGTATSIATGNIGGVLAGGAAAIGNKLFREQGNHWLATMANRLSRFETRFEVATQALAGLRKLEPRKAIAPASVSLRERFNETKRQVQELQNPERATTVLAQVSNGFDDRPDIAMALHERVLGDAQYLQAQMPPALTRAATSLTPTAEKVRIPPSAMKRFMAKADALADPLSVLEELADGRVNRDAIEAIKARRPRLFEAMREQVMVYAAQRGESLPYQQRILLSLAFDFAGDHSMRPGVLARIQQSVAAPEEGAPEAPQSGAQINPRAADNTATPSQRAIGGMA